jgi:hypothetical protein
MVPGRPNGGVAVDHIHVSGIDLIADFSADSASLP